MSIDFKYVHAACLYSNGFFMTLNKKHVEGIMVEWFDIYEKPFSAHLDFTGCLVFTGIYSHDRGEVGLLKGAVRVTSRKPSINHGSEATKEKCIQVGYTSFYNKNFKITVYDIPGYLGSDVCLKEESVVLSFEEMNDKVQFNGVHIKKRVPASAKAA